MRNDRPPVVLALTPVVERAIEPLLFGAEASVDPCASVGEADELEQVAGQHAVAVLVSADLPGLTPGHCARARARGGRVVGIALNDFDRHALTALAVDEIFDATDGGNQLDFVVRGARDAVSVEVPRPSPARVHGSGSAVAVVGSKGAPGSSECAASLAALAAGRWPSLLVELDALGGALDIRLAADAHQGSLLGVVRAAEAGDGAVRDLVERWLTRRDGWPPVLLGPPDRGQALPELGRPGAVAAAVRELAAVSPLTVLDVGFLLGDGDDAGAVARVHREAIVAADAVLLVLGAREEQLRSGLAQLEVLVHGLGIGSERLRVVVNGVGAPGAIGRTELGATLAERLAEYRLTLDGLLPWDRRGLAKATRAGIPLAVARARGPYARALAALLEQLFLPVTPEPRERKRMLVPPSSSQNTQEEVALPWRTP